MTGFVCQSAPAEAIFEPGSACGSPYAPLELFEALILHPDSFAMSHSADSKSLDEMPACDIKV